MPKDLITVYNKSTRTTKSTGKSTSNNNDTNKTVEKIAKTNEGLVWTAFPGISGTLYYNNSSNISVFGNVPQNTSTYLLPIIGDTKAITITGALPPSSFTFNADVLQGKSIVKSFTITIPSGPPGPSQNNGNTNLKTLSCDNVFKLVYQPALLS